MSARNARVWLAPQKKRFAALRQGVTKWRFSAKKRLKAHMRAIMTKKSASGRELEMRILVVDDHDALR